MGAYGEKQAYNATEEAFLKVEESKQVPLKKVVRGDYFMEELDPTKLTRGQL
jgi:hypothetical protein